MNKKRTTVGAAGAIVIAAALLIGNAGNALAAATFTRDLTLGSSGSDVIALQAMLIGQGFPIQAGATGYFGAQTKAALASYQAAHSIAPAAGYFGSITRASVNASAGPGTSNDGNSGGTSSGSELSGGEATLRNFDLITGSDLSAGDTNEEIAVAEFDVRGGDVRVQRVTLSVSAQTSSLNTQPWRYLDTLSVYNGSKKVGNVEAGSRNDWDKDGSGYSIDIPVNVILKAGSVAELSIRADAQESISSGNTGQTFSVTVPKDGIRAVDAKNIQRYIGSDSDAVILGFGTEDSGKLSLRESSDNPESGVIVADTTDTSGTHDVLAFEIKNSSDADVDLTQLTFRIDAVFANGSVSGEDVQNIIRRATLKLDGKTYTGTVSGIDSGSYEGAITFKNLRTAIDGNDTIDGTLSVDLFGSSNRYDQGAILSFSLLSADVEAEGNRSGNDASVSGNVAGNAMTISTDAGIRVAGRSTTADAIINSSTPSSSYGTYTLRFDVTATGDDVYVPRSVSIDSTASTTAGAGIVIVSDFPFSGMSSAVLTSSARTYNSDYYLVREGETKTFTVTLTIDPDAARFYSAALDYVQFYSVDSNFMDIQKLDVDQDNAQFRTDPVYLPN